MSHLTALRGLLAKAQSTTKELERLSSLCDPDLQDRIDRRMAVATQMIIEALMLAEGRQLTTR